MRVDCVREAVMPTLAQIYEEHAEECIRSASKTDDPKYRDMLLKLASAWREDAEELRPGAGGALSDAPAPARR
jgi:hypothetical protein